VVAILRTSAGWLDPSLAHAGTAGPGRAALGRVLAPTLLSSTASTVGAEMSLEVVPGAGHLSEESGPLERVAELAVGVVHAPARHLTSWFPAPVRW
jgi:hypothetical protein